MSGDDFVGSKRKSKPYLDKMLSETGSLLLACFSGITYACSSAVVKHITNIHPAQLLLCAYSFVTLITLPEIVWRGDNILKPPDGRAVICIRSVASSGAILFGYIAYRHLPLGLASIIICSYPAFTAIGAKFFLKEPLGFLQIIAVALTVIGMIFIFTPHETVTEKSLVYSSDEVYGLTAALGSVLCCALFYILTRKSKQTSACVLQFTVGFVAAVSGVVVVLVVDKFRLVYRGLQQFLVILLGICAYCAQLTLIVAMKNMDSGPVTIIRAASNILICFLWQVVFSHDIPNRMTVLGVVLISLAIILIGLRKQIITRVPKACVKFC